MEGLNRAPVRQIFIESIADVTPNMTSDNLAYVEVVTQTGAPATTAELGTIPEKDFAFQEFKALLRKSQCLINTQLKFFLMHHNL